MKNLKLFAKVGLTIVGIAIADLITFLAGLVFAGILIIQIPVVLLISKILDRTNGTLSRL